MVVAPDGPVEKTLGVHDFATAFGEQLSDYVAAQIARYSFRYVELSAAEQETLLIKIVETLLDPEIMQSGEHRLGHWETGWGENLALLRDETDAITAIRPKYFNKYGAIRWCGKFIRPLSEHFESHSLSIIIDWLFDKYCREVPAIYEFGCGTGHHLLHARRVNPLASLWGLDWATSSQQIIERLAREGVDPNIRCHRFDYFNPDTTFRLAPNAIVYTVASLEQVGTRWENFVDYLIENKPVLCFHVEPIAELLDSERLIDYLSIEYFKKRNYLSGFLQGLRRYESAGRLKIHRAQRTHIGSLFIEGYSVVVWSPL